MTTQKSPAELLAAESVLFDVAAADVDDAIRLAGEALVAAGAVEPEYIAAMLERERTVSTYVGEGVAVPHGTLAAKGTVKRDAIVFLRLAEPVDWNGSEVTVVIGIAARGRGHIGLLSQLASVLLDPERGEALRAAATAADVVDALSITT
jgi:PTS system mannitol-specific IIA component